MSNWLFACNRKRWRVFDLFADGETTVGWRTVNYRNVIRAGDRAPLWLSGPGGGARLRFASSFVEQPVRRDDLAADSVFSKNRVITMPRAANPIVVTDEQWEAVLARKP